MSADPLPPELEAALERAHVEIRAFYTSSGEQWRDMPSPIDRLRAFAREIQELPYRHEHNGAIGSALERLERLKLRAPRSWSEGCMDVPTLEMESLRASQHAGEALAEALEPLLNNIMDRQAFARAAAALSSWRALSGEKP